MSLGIGVHLDRVIDEMYKIQKEEVNKVSKLKRLIQRITKQKK